MFFSFLDVRLSFFCLRNVGRVACVFFIGRDDHCYANFHLVLNHKFWNLTVNWFCLSGLIEAYFYFAGNQTDCGFFSFLSLDLFWYFIINIIFNGRFPSLFVGTDGCFPCFPYVRIFLFVCYFFQWQSAGSSICFLSIDRFVLVLYRLRFKRQISFLICGHGWSFFLHEEFLREDFLLFCYVRLFFCFSNVGERGRCICTQISFYPYVKFYVKQSNGLTNFDFFIWILINFDEVD